MQKTRKTVRRMGAGLGPGLAQTQALDHDHSQAQGKDPKDPGEFLDLFRCVEPGMYLSSGQIGFGAKDIKFPELCCIVVLLFSPAATWREKQSPDGADAEGCSHEVASVKYDGMLRSTPA
ncbi:hypothetical protein Y1Q_0022900 [Alligator mississippiensis]|uniref:Uncharacterized protein n=1 Tax=Alligator mississippiensis TaxID=8496 RepID=A0A151N5G3_ALLMI|nr:hypothetical protein Y1Q_0022900 [Alligator mississippiensis]